MKKMMIIAVMMSAMLMPAQMMAKNDKNVKVKIEYKVDNKKEKKDFRFDDKKFKNDKKFKKRNDKKFKNKPKKKSNKQKSKKNKKNCSAQSTTSNRCLESVLLNNKFKKMPKKKKNKSYDLIIKRVFHFIKLYDIICLLDNHARILP